MKLNCKQGDLAVIVRSTNGNEGKVLTCLRLATFSEVSAQGFTGWGWPVWVTDAQIPCVWGYMTELYPDDRLRPLRDSDGQDEMLRLVGLPNVDTPLAAQRSS
jgi:hypothetical protein